MRWLLISVASFLGLWPVYGAFKMFLASVELYFGQAFVALLVRSQSSCLVNGTVGLVVTQTLLEFVNAHRGIRQSLLLL